MKKMKKLFSKITTLVLLVAMLVPYTSIPKVEAETTSCDNWEYHTNYYFFLEADHPETWASYFTNSGKSYFESNFYTSFLYNFPYDGSSIVFDEENSGFVPIKHTSNQYDYETDFNPLTDNWTAAQFYYEYIKEGNGAAGDYQSYVYNFSNNGKSQNDSIVTYLYHGPWASAGNGSTINLNKSGKLKFQSGGVALDISNTRIQNHIEKLVDATIFIDRGEATISNAKIGYGSQNGSVGNLDYSLNGIKSQIDLFNENKGKTNTGTVNPNSGNPIISLLITRKYYLDDIFTSTLSSALGASNVNNLILKNERYGENSIETNTGIYAYSSSSTTAGAGKMLYFPGKSYRASNESTEMETKASNSKIAYGNGTNGETTTDVSYQTSYKLSTTYDSDEVDWFFAPTLYKISYKVCKSSNSIDANQVTLSYASSKEGATGLPADDTKAKGSAFTVSTQEPSLEGYKFQLWSTDPQCGNSGSEFEPGAKFSDSLNNSTTLYACWGPTNGGNQVDSGVLTYAGLFTGIIALAGGSYYLIKKKNVFKKI